MRLGLHVDGVRERPERQRGKPVGADYGPRSVDWAGNGEQISGEQISMDAFDFCRSVSGRGTATGLLREQVPF